MRKEFFVRVRIRQTWHRCMTVRVNGEKSEACRKTLEIVRADLKKTQGKYKFKLTVVECAEEGVE